ncbi:MAG: hypothetical protein JWQ43_1496 [Glaciihabitans sp.]|nr:hypothetical protein [Glaciihabitans sp.]
MPVLGDVETFYEDGGWRNRVEGSGTTALSFRTLAEAIKVGRAEAQKSRTEHTIRDESGSIAERHSYAVQPEAAPSD